MTFNSFDELKKYILSRSEIAIKLAQEKVYQVINKFVKQYYAEFSPEVYERTYQLFRSLVKSDIKQTANGWVAEVYFDLDALDYHMKLVNGIPRPNEGASEKKTLESAMIGEKPHGGYASGTSIWTESLSILNQERYNMLKKVLNDAGIPVK